MKLSFNVIGLGEVFSINLEEAHRQADLVAEVVDVVEKRGTKLVNRGVKAMSGFWVKRMMAK